MQASDPNTYELIQKIHALQKRLISKTEEVVEKELLLQVQLACWMYSAYIHVFLLGHFHIIGFIFAQVLFLFALRDPYIIP